MEPGAAPDGAPEAASLIVTDPGGHRARMPVEPLPFTIGRQPGSSLILRDTRVSRTHARILAQEDRYLLEDCGSRHGTFVNGQRITRHVLNNSDKIEFGTPESYSLIFAVDGAELKRLMEQMGASDTAAAAGVGGNLAKLRSILDLARSLENSFSMNDVLAQVVDTALAVTGAERGFLLLRTGNELETRVARHRKGHKLHVDDLRVPRAVIHRALQHRRELLSMNFDSGSGADLREGKSIIELELRSVVCVPLVRMRAGHSDTTNLLSTGSETVGVLYMDSRIATADLAGGNRELLQTLAIEASTVLENARLLEEERLKQQMEEELRVARTIQQSLLPASLPCTGWLRAAGSSVASHQVGGDYFDVTLVNPQCWCAVVADVSGKGVSSALLASLLQGALIIATDSPAVLGLRMESLNTFLLERTGGEKYATVFYCLLEQGGRLSYVNAAQCPPMVVGRTGNIVELDATSVPVGLMPNAKFEVAEHRLAAGDKVVIYTDGVSEAQARNGEFFGKKRLRELLKAYVTAPSQTVQEAIQAAVSAFTEGTAQSDDITAVVLEYYPPELPPTTHS